MAQAQEMAGANTQILALTMGHGAHLGAQC